MKISKDYAINIKRRSLLIVVMSHEINPTGDIGVFLFIHIFHFSKFFLITLRGLKTTQKHIFGQFSLKFPELRSGKGVSFLSHF